ncbi:MAG: Lrp/AsnC family transcriptional regulator [Nitrososphaerota archaeon]|nr:Lrp/AsnC family transcriptional regulator [Candidatus Bathyarchaeota archaeon]MDW8024090.1 Lrp/AsnC family transcriptional regulator [Nitrososphaerota archaeon]
MAKQKLVELLYELIKDSKRSDRELAKVLGVSQPTITRMRRTLEEQEYIRGYTVIPALEKLGYEILALSFVKTSLTSEFGEWISKNPKIVFAGSCESPYGGKAVLIASIHENYTDFSKFTREIEGLVGSNTSLIKSFPLSLNVDVIKHFSLKNLEQVR